MEEKIKHLVSNIDSEITITFDYNNVSLSKESWTVNFRFVLDDDDEDKTIMLLNEYINDLYKIESIVQEENIEIWFNNEELTICHEEWQKEYNVPLEKHDFSVVYEIIKNFFTLKYIPVKACYREDYFEVLINHTQMVWGDGLSHISIAVEDGNRSQDRIYYEIGPISKEFSTVIENEQFYRHLEVEDNFTTLKIYISTKYQISPLIMRISKKNNFIM